MIETGFEEEKERLWENIKRESIVKDEDRSTLNKLLTLIDMPSFIGDSSKSKTFLPTIPQYKDTIPYSKQQKRRPSVILDDHKNFSSNYSRLELEGLSEAIQMKIEIDMDKGYMEITPELAIGLRQMILGNLKILFSFNWRNAYFSFKSTGGTLGYSLHCDTNECRSLTSIIQAYFLKNLLFHSGTSNETRSRHLLVSEYSRNDCLVRTLSEILWRLGQSKCAYVCLQSDTSYVFVSPFYNCDKITETLRIFTFQSIETLLTFMRKHIHFFTSPKYSGYIQFIYSAVLSKGLQNLFEDFEFDAKRCLFDSTDAMSQSAINMLLTGFATPYLHNGVMFYDPETSEAIRPQYGLKQRSLIGYLQYTQIDDTDYLYMAKSIRRASEGVLRSSLDLDQIQTVGSMLKTPKYPIWVVNGNGFYGVIFCLKEDLLNHWKAETNFKLMYLNCMPNQQEPCLIDISTKMGRSAKFKTSLFLRHQNKKTPLLNHLINTKWYGCKIEWNGMPFI